MIKVLGHGLIAVDVKFLTLYCLHGSHLQSCIYQIIYASDVLTPLPPPPPAQPLCWGPGGRDRAGEGGGSHVVAGVVVGRETEAGIRFGG